MSKEKTGTITFAGWEPEFDDQPSDEVFRVRITYKDRPSENLVGLLLDKTPVHIIRAAEIASLRQQFAQERQLREKAEALLWKLQPAVDLEHLEFEDLEAACEYEYFVHDRAASKKQD